MDKTTEQLKTTIVNALLTGIVNWKSTLKGFLKVYNSVFTALTGAQMAQAGIQVHYAKWFLLSGLVAQLAVSWFSRDVAAPAPDASASNAASETANTTVLPQPGNLDSK